MTGRGYCVECGYDNGSQWREGDTVFNVVMTMVVSDGKGILC